MRIVANNTKGAQEKRTPGPRQNAQGDHEGSAHSPDEFDVMNPKKQDNQKPKAGSPPRRPAPKV